MDKVFIENLEIDVIEGSTNISFVWEKIVSSYVNIIKDINNPLLTSIQKGGGAFKQDLERVREGIKEGLQEVGTGIKEFTESIITRYKLDDLKPYFSLAGIATKISIIDKFVGSKIIPPVAQFMATVAGVPLLSKVSGFFMGGGLAAVSIGIASRLKTHIFTGESYNFNTTEKNVYMNLSKRPIITLIALPKEYTGKVQANVSYFTNNDSTIELDEMIPFTFKEQSLSIESGGLVIKQGTNTNENFVEKINQHLKQKIVKSVNTKGTQQDRFNDFITTIKPDIDMCVNFMNTCRTESSVSDSSVSDSSVKELIEYDGDIFMNISDLTIDTIDNFQRSFNERYNKYKYYIFKPH